GAALVDLFQAGTNDPPEGGFLFGQSPAKIDVGEGNATLAAQRTDLREDLPDKMLPLFLQVPEGRGYEDAEFSRSCHTPYGPGKRKRGGANEESRRAAGSRRDSVSTAGPGG